MKAPGLKRSSAQAETSEAEQPLPREERGFSGCARWLKRTFRFPYPLTIRRAGRADARHAISVAAICYRKGRRLYIVVAKNLPDWIAIHFLLHESAHAMTWRQDWVEKHRPEHDEEWSLAFGKVYRAWFDDQ